MTINSSNHYEYRLSMSHTLVLVKHNLTLGTSQIINLGNVTRETAKLKAESHYAKAAAFLQKMGRRKPSVTFNL